KDTWLGRWKTRRLKREFDALEAQANGLYPLRRRRVARGRALRKVAPQDPRIALWRGWIAAARAREADVRRELFERYPKGASILPTRFGNAIRSFENYPERQYGMFAITLWPRLVAVIEPAYAEVIDGAKSSVDFMINSSLLSAALGFVMLLTGLVYPAPFASRAALAAWLFEVAVLVALARWLYVQAIDGVLGWGSLVRGAFDLYRGKLLEKLGYVHAPGSIEEERQLWRAISDRISAGDPQPGAWEIPPYTRQAAPSASATSTSGEALTVTRGVQPLAGGGLRVVLLVRHPATDPRARQLAGVVLTDSGPDGFSYLWGSEAASAGTVEVAGINPFQFRASDPLPPAGALQVEYSIVPLGRRRP
ncbi:MAG TPA: hypothetical protein VGE98_13425, partial [Thermoanaerobaculia bacterium]